MIYLDNNATTPTTPGVRAAVLGALENAWANPSSLHRSGQRARRAVELARRDVATLIGAKPRQLVFTSGGTESAILAIKSIVYAPSLDRPVIVSTKTEHPAVRTMLSWLERSGTIEVRWAPVDLTGAVRLDELEPMLDGATLVSIQWAGNETGTIQPVREIARLAHARACLFHCDATQMVGKMPVDVGIDESPDLLTLASHKFHGPKGIGALYARDGVELRSAQPGSQELGRRGGTENVPGIVGMAAAALEAIRWLTDDKNIAQGAALRDHLEHEILNHIDGCIVNGPTHTEAPREAHNEAHNETDSKTDGEFAHRLWNTTNIAFPVSSEALLMSLSERGVCASGGAACASGSLEPSPVLLAMGLSEERASRSIRFSLSRFTTRAEVDEAVRTIVDAIGLIRA